MCSLDSVMLDDLWAQGPMYGQSVLLHNVLGRLQDGHGEHHIMYTKTLLAGTQEAVHVATVSKPCQGKIMHRPGSEGLRLILSATQQLLVRATLALANKSSCGEISKPPHLSARQQSMPNWQRLAKQSPVGVHAQLLLPHCVIAQPCQHQVEGKLAHAGG